MRAGLLARELREVVGPEPGGAPSGQTGSAGRTHATRGPSVSTLVATRQILLITLLLAIAVGGVLTLVTDSWWASVGALAVHAAATLVAAGSAIRLTTQTEHVAPEVAARLEDEDAASPTTRLVALLVVVVVGVVAFMVLMGVLMDVL